VPGSGYRATPRRRHERAVTLIVGDRLEQTPGTRRCQHPDCGALLSRYNPAPTCSAHGGWETPREPGRRPRRHLL
jgi:hypothetical protein